MTRVIHEGRILGGFSDKAVIVVGAGPAGLIAAETLAASGCKVHIYDRKPSVARKFLMAGRGGLNLTHSEDLPQFLQRYGAASDWLAPMVADFDPQRLRDWCDGLGQKTFIGSSGRVFPQSMKASPLLRAWLARLESLNVQFHLQKTWTGWREDGRVLFRAADGAEEAVQADAVLLALGGASWPGLGSDGLWTRLLQEKGIGIVPLRPANCGFVCEWSEVFAQKFAGQPLKGVTIECNGRSAKGEAMMSTNGIEGGVIYALSSHIRSVIEREGRASISIDLKPSQSVKELSRKLDRERGKMSLSNYLQKTISLPPVAINLLRETGDDLQSMTPDRLAARIKDVRVTFTSTFPIERAISSAGGISLVEVDDDLRLKKMRKVFVAGEMLDWEAPTGGYLLQACFATGVRAARGILRHLAV